MEFVELHFHPTWALSKQDYVLATGQPLELCVFDFGGMTSNFGRFHASSMFDFLYG